MTAPEVFVTIIDNTELESAHNKLLERDKTELLGTSYPDCLVD